jgi:twitching motility protein PilT
MENFKKALKQAIVEKAEAVRIEDGQSPHLLHFSSEKAMAQLPVATTHDVQALMESLVASGEPLGETAREGVLAIVNFGELKLIAQFTTPLRLFAFIPPQGNQMYQQVKGQILGSEKPAPTPIDIAPNRGKFQLATFPAQSGDLDKLTMAPKKEALSVPTDDEFEGGTSAAALAPFAIAPQADPFSMPPAKSDPFSMPPAKADPFASAALFQADPFAASQADADPFSSPVLAKALPFESEIPVEIRKTHPTMVSSIRQEFSPIPSEVSQMGAFDSNLSLPSAMHSGGRPTENTDADYHYQGPHSVASRKPEPEPVDEHVIHYSAFIPGETIDRNSRAFPIDTVLQDMIKRKASDLHATMGEVLCMRIDGEIERVGKEIVNEDYMRSILDPIIPPRNREEFAKGNDTDFAYEVPGLARFRVNIFRDRMGVGAVLRQIPEKILSADDLGLPAAVRKFCELSKGLVVVTGPTGSGKSTTLAGMVDLINETRHEHILTIEDPIEFVHKQKNCLLNQREVHKHTKSFSRALRAALREDPDIILIGEMRDLETVEIAIETAETGHLVFGTLHTNTAISTVDRLIDQFPSNQQAQIRVMLAESLKGVVAQTLVRKKGGGRVAALEILVVDKAVASLIREGNTHMMGNHMQTQKAKGNVMLNDSLLNLVVKGIVDAKDAYMKAIEKEAFLTMLAAKGITLEVAKSA